MRLLRISWLGVTGYPLRSLLSVIALAFAVIGIVTIAAAATTVERTVTERAVLQNGPSSTIAVTGFEGLAGAQAAQDLEAYLQAYLEESGIVVRVEVAGPTAVDAGPTTEGLTIYFTEPALIHIRPFPVLEGEWLSSTASDFVLPIVLNRAARAALGSAVGDTVEIRVPGVSTPTRALVLGVIDDGEISPNAFATSTHGVDFLDVNEVTRTSELLVSDPSASVSTIELRVNSWRSLASAPLILGIEQRDTVDQLAQEIAGTRSVFLIVAISGLLSGGLGIANIGLSAARERSNEMSLRRALGARAWQIPAILLIEAQLVALFAGAIAIVVSYLLYPLAATLFASPYGIEAPDYPWSAAALGIAVGMCTALVASVVPAIHALQVSMSRILRA